MYCETESLAEYDLVVRRYRVPARFSRGCPSVVSEVLAVRDDPLVNVDQVFLQHPFVPYLRAAHGTTMLWVLAAFLPFVPDQRLHPPVLLPAGRAEVPSQPLVVVGRDVRSGTCKNQRTMC